ncbi:hypothetical protein [Tsukamurella paurometabola]|uniref:Terminase small subunit n=1 Tax=Tsukamurella paurometabola TaxID=2061 RepID=A0A3P8MBR4_TSUPA|nr:hypothetical protein [Tsukamurella paurometabola]UEA84419.1 hypothetical protein LK411_06240 [Tsukamurella paurometabola]VDR36983.1 Uncharacterised protein [Tsukamurella paurometabola]
MDAEPDGLDAAGRKLFAAITSQYKLRADELRVLEDACFEADLIDSLREELKDQPTLVRGSQGQKVINPMISELRQHRATLSNLLKQLRLPDPADTAEARSTQARAAANARWQKRTG